MAVAEGWTQGVVADDIPTFDGDAGELFGAIAAVLVTEDVFLSNVLRARRMLTQELGLEVAFGSVIPKDAELGADELDIFRFHLKRVRRCESGKVRRFLLIKSDGFELIHQGDGWGRTV